MPSPVLRPAAGAEALLPLAAPLRFAEVDLRCAVGDMALSMRGALELSIRRDLAMIKPVRGPYVVRCPDARWPHLTGADLAEGGLLSSIWEGIGSRGIR
jgi:hypothetical protein